MLWMISKRCVLGAAAGAALLIGCTAGAVGFGNSPSAAQRHCSSAGQIVDRTLADARRFRRIDLSYAGPRVVDLPLTEVGCSMMPTADKPVITKPPESYGLMPRWDFSYGTCTASGGEGGCALPVDIQNNGSCWDNLGLFTKADRPRLHSLRGVPSATSVGPDGGEVVLYTRRTTVTIDAPNLRQAMRIALALRGVNAPYPAQSTLPPPSRQTLDGKTKCRTG